MNMHNLPAKLPSLPSIVKEYDDKIASIPALCEEYKDLHTKVDLASTIGGTYVGRAYSYHASLSERTIKTNLLESAWRYVYNGLNITEIASASDRKRFDLSLKNPPEFTIDNIGATFGDYVKDPRFHILKGLAECFVGLDPAYKSHSKVKVGVKGLPKRVIINAVLGDWGTAGYGADKLKDTINALNVFQGDPHMDHGEFRDLLAEAKKEGEVEYKGLTLKVYANGNGHLIFSKHKLVQINDALAEFYGDTLPDAEDENATFRPGTNVSANLAYYPTPRAVIAEVCRRDLSLKAGQTVLEPSCGDGAIMDYLREQEPGLRQVGIEYHAGRANEARAKGHKVQTANFLQIQPNPIFDLILMNPPFNGKHWRKHLDHARKFLKPATERGHDGGRIICILPASAYYDGHLDDLLWAKRGYRCSEQWRDLPVASFAESGTNIPTGYFQLT